MPQLLRGATRPKREGGGAALKWFLKSIKSQMHVIYQQWQQDLLSSPRIKRKRCQERNRSNRQNHRLDRMNFI